ncbi:hypothetical protein HaLaN_21541 [Haematococcus lacustris]|uniref:Uncharacterized protein n=1 Tax=Haematococcus lacustris TaxID=44745 RepID=A0A699ZMF8_HAELA|nr:hypothetical protein HaLaN_21541 [Haematococcus lacustris]
MGCPEVPLVVVEDDVAFAPNFYNHLSNLHKSALALAGSDPFMLTLYRPSPVNNTVNVMKRVRDIQNRSGTPNNAESQIAGAVVCVLLAWLRLRASTPQ